MKIHRSKILDELVEGCIRDDPRAQQTLYERFSPLMFAVCLRYIKEIAEAEDVLLKAFMKVFSSIRKFRGEGSLEGWIRRIVVNESLMYLRQNKTLYLTVDVESAKSASTVASDHLEAADLLSIVQQLPVGYRTVFNLYAIEGYAHAEIAGMLGISEGTSKSQLSRAKMMLRNMLSTQNNVRKDQIG